MPIYFVIEQQLVNHLDFFQIIIIFIKRQTVIYYHPNYLFITNI